jgi:2-succinyl-5-enolpyruvyl-6-hydroxy-3-cyclohexene-1-carboxylate synthase
MAVSIPLDTCNINTVWSSLLVEELLRNQIDYFCISPGSRSAPLTVAIARHPQAKKILCHDERGAAFHALGYARSTGKPAVLICTSGTAAANYFPAFIEAAMDRLPLLVISADRPPELQETGANQTIRQGHLFGSYAKWYFELPCPTQTLSPRVLLTSIDQGVYQALSSPHGPVHLNFPLREPLAPIAEAVDAAYLEPLGQWFAGKEPLTRYQSSLPIPTPASVRQVSDILKTTQTGLVSVGRLNTDSESAAVLRLLQQLQWPAFVDITSGLRLGSVDMPVIHYFDQMLLSKAFCNRYRPDTLLHIGGQIVSQRFLEFTEQSHPPGNYIVVKDHPFRYDPWHRVSCHLEVDIGAFCQALAEQLEPQAPPAPIRTMLDLSASVGTVIRDFIQPEHAVNEIAVAYLIAANLPARHGLWLASSMPVRDMDRYGSPRTQAVRMGANRGTSGIEGSVAAATGFASGLQQPVTLVTGDLALLHDLNSLALVKKINQPLVIVVINNNGGGIFSFLPIAEFRDVFEDYFGTPHHLRFQAAAALFSIPYVAPRTNAELVSAYRTAVDATAATLIEVATDRQENYRLHQRLQRLIANHIDSRLS